MPRAAVTFFSSRCTAPSRRHLLLRLDRRRARCAAAGLRPGPGRARRRLPGRGRQRAREDIAAQLPLEAATTEQAAALDAELERGCKTPVPPSARPQPARRAVRPARPPALGRGRRALSRPAATAPRSARPASATRKRRAGTRRRRDPTPARVGLLLQRRPQLAARLQRAADNPHRYRQWLTHKLGSWHDQYGRSGCVGCGRCITWCPVGIDITEEAAAICGEGGA
jgi:hypothetical protein